MTIIFTSYTGVPQYSDPEEWLRRIEGYTGILEKLAEQHTVISIERINYEGELLRNGVRYVFIRQKKQKLLFPHKIHRMMKAFHPDVVFINGFNYPFQLIQLRFHLGSKIRVYILHRAERPFQGWKQYLQKLAARSIDGWLFSSAALGTEWIQKGIIPNPEKIYEVIQASSHFTVSDKSKARERLSISANPVYLWVKRMDADKDPLTVIRAFRQFVTHTPTACLYLIYQGTRLLDEAKELAGKECIEGKKIVFVGKVAHNDLQDWYNSADFIIASSYYEGSGVAVSEAMSCGCIPIVTDIPSFRKMTSEGSCGWLFPSGNSEALLEILQQSVYADVDKGRAAVLEQFRKELSFDAIGRKINQIITH